MEYVHSDSLFARGRVPEASPLFVDLASHESSMHVFYGSQNKEFGMRVMALLDPVETEALYFEAMRDMGYGVSVVRNGQPDPEELCTAELRASDPENTITDILRQALYMYEGHKQHRLLLDAIIDTEVPYSHTIDDLASVSYDAVTQSSVDAGNLRKRAMVTNLMLRTWRPWRFQAATTPDIEGLIRWYGEARLQARPLGYEELSGLAGHIMRGATAWLGVQPPKKYTSNSVRSPQHGSYSKRGRYGL